MIQVAHAKNDLVFWHYQNELHLWNKSKLLSDIETAGLSIRFLNRIYHPNISIRILLFIATTIAIFAATSLALLIAFNTNDESVFAFLALVFSVLMLLLLDRVVIGQKQHFKSGVSEAFLYMAIAYLLGAVSYFSDFNPNVCCITAFIVFVFTSMRYLDLLSLCGAFFSLIYLAFSLFNGIGVLSAFPFVAALLSFAVYYFGNMRSKSDLEIYWHDSVLLVKCLGLLGIMLSLNYYVVHQLSVELMGISPKSALPYGAIFWLATFLLPCVYLYFGIKNKQLYLLRIALLGLAVAVFTFKYYYSIAPIEFTLTLGGFLLLGISLGLMAYLKTPKYGFTREKLLSEDWNDLQAEAAAYAQSTMPNAPKEENTFQGGSFGGGGAGGAF